MARLNEAPAATAAAASSSTNAPAGQQAGTESVDACKCATLTFPSNIIFVNITRNTTQKRVVHAHEIKTSPRASSR